MMQTLNGLQGVFSTLFGDTNEEILLLHMSLFDEANKKHQMCENGYKTTTKVHFGQKNFNKLFLQNDWRIRTAVFE